MICQSFLDPLTLIGVDITTQATTFGWQCTSTILPKAGHVYPRASIRHRVVPPRHPAALTNRLPSAAPPSAVPRHPAASALPSHPRKVSPPRRATAPPGRPRHQAALRRAAPSGSFRLASLSPHMEATSAAAASARTAPSPCVVRLPTSSPAPVDCANIDPATIPIPLSPSLDAPMDLPPLRVPLFVPEPDTQATVATTTAAASSARVGLKDSHHNTANAPDASFVSRSLLDLMSGALQLLRVLVLPPLPQFLSTLTPVTCGTLDEQLIEMAATYRAPNRSLSPLQASVDRTAARLASPSTPLHHRTGESTGVSHVVPHGCHVRMTPVWDNAFQCGGDWIAWKQRFLSELKLSGTFTEAQKLAELRNNASPSCAVF
ncbi:MAG: hypothetical protein BJ554DRAFT_7469 [Olpidium bornovanus]|uniref:Uncharacterized protein n=1 Tax=Olpidium bornovanus TaxID=278681 RepID=A0A8H8DJ85_9FUNG|nr:MAG: hypothetical protein BJ554DRAFT_7469 [Olpidium bornovanus]